MLAKLRIGDCLESQGMVTMAALAALATTSLGSKLSLGSAMNGNTKRAQSNAAVPVVSSMVAGLLRVHAAKGIQGGLNFARSDNNRVQIFARPEYLKRIETSKKYYAIDPENECKVVDIAAVVECKCTFVDEP